MIAFVHITFLSTNRVVLFSKTHERVVVMGATQFGISELKVLDVLESTDGVGLKYIVDFNSHTPRGVRHAFAESSNNIIIKSIEKQGKGYDFETLRNIALFSSRMDEFKKFDYKNTKFIRSYEF